jgi:hypothetical protein
MSTRIRTLLTLVALAGTGFAAQAQTAAAPVVSATASMPHADQRTARQQKRIAQGAASGTLTPRETQRLEKEQAAIGRAETRAAADGKVTAKERHHVAALQNHASADIHRQKHDAQRVGPAASSTIR